MVNGLYDGDMVESLVVKNLRSRLDAQSADYVRTVVSIARDGEYGDVAIFDESYGRAIDLGFSHYDSVLMAAESVKLAMVEFPVVPMDVPVGTMDVLVDPFVDSTTPPPDQPNS